ncbi:hypothetical protein WDU94_000118 [Cyamophila willieti]
MGQLEENEVAKQHHELCQALNIDSTTAMQAWSSYKDMSHHYLLEGSQLHWLGCSLYVSCRKATVPTVNTNRTIEGNLVCLTSLLKHCKMSMIHATPTKVFEFTWILFVLTKAEYLDVSNDLVDAFHLLIATCDLIYANVIQSKLKDLVNPEFPGMPAGFLSPATPRLTGVMHHIPFSRGLLRTKI